MPAWVTGECREDRAGHGRVGYIGSHAVLQLLLAGFYAVGFDNLNNSSELAVRRVAALAGDHSRNRSFHKVTTRPGRRDFGGARTEEGEVAGGDGNSAKS